ncbi:OLC1v1024617C1 [Oldenlandia corymbosa var. corymbosa]|uniref:OLC1v1024617C1 n=1 Tax=Oldenlandia corymbosa var. corymbosa TaxID=529605 RepID=A0AAV1C2U8_OLDCO|nr:OLC1v1024617C1 [Oldenlandia corymbosa var. corymbosa]
MTKPVYDLEPLVVADSMIIHATIDPYFTLISDKNDGVRPLVVELDDSSGLNYWKQIPQIGRFAVENSVDMLFLVGKDTETIGCHHDELKLFNVEKFESMCSNEERECIVVNGWIAEYLVSSLFILDSIRHGSNEVQRNSLDVQSGGASKLYIVENLLTSKVSDEKDSVLEDKDGLEATNCMFSLLGVCLSCEDWVKKLSCVCVDMEEWKIKNLERLYEEHRRLYGSTQVAHSMMETIHEIDHNPSTSSIEENLSKVQKYFEEQYVLWYVILLDLSDVIWKIEKMFNVPPSVLDSFPSHKFEDNEECIRKLELELSELNDNLMHGDPSSFFPTLVPQRIHKRKPVNFNVQKIERKPTCSLPSFDNFDEKDYLIFIEIVKSVGCWFVEETIFEMKPANVEKDIEDEWHEVDFEMDETTCALEGYSNISLFKFGYIRPLTIFEVSFLWY